MYCYAADKKQCLTSAEQRAFDGTTCGKKKWCMNGKCVPDSRAPDAPGKNNNAVYLTTTQFYLTYGNAIQSSLRNT